MPILDGVKLAEVNRKFQAVFLRELGTATRWSLSGDAAIARMIPTTGSELKPKFAARAAGVHEWIDERQKGGIRVFDFTIPVKKWANGLQMKVDDLEDDQANLGVLMDQIADMPDDFVEHKHQLNIDLLVAGFAATKGLAYDGQFFFDSDHRDGPEQPTQRNVRAGLAFSSTNLYTAIADMSIIRRPNGQLANLRPTHGLFPEALRGTVEGVLGVPILANGASNPHYRRVEPIYDSRLDAAGFNDGWFLFDLSKRIKPLVHADRKAVGFRAKISPTGEKMFDEDVAEWGADARYNAAYYFWQVAWGSDGP